MDNLCDNPLCQHHILIPPYAARAGYVYLHRNGEEYIMRRHQYVSADGTCIVHLCDVCHNAVNMATNR